MGVRTELNTARASLSSYVAKEEQHGRSPRSLSTGGPWTMVASPLTDYCLNFKNLLIGTHLIGPYYPEDLLGNFARELSGRRAKPYVLDVFADETVVRELVDDYGFAGGVAMTVALKPVPIDKSEYSQTGLVSGNVLNRTTWRRLTEKMGELDIPIFDLIISRGEGALVSITDNPNVHYFLLQQLWSRLNPDGGVLLLQLPYTKGVNLENWANNASKQKVPIQLGHDGLFPIAMITRLPEAPAQFPHLPISS